MHSSEIEEHAFGSETSLYDYCDLVLRRIWVVVATFGIAVTITLIYVFSCTPLFTSVATVKIQEKGAKAGDKDNVYGSPQYDQFKGYLSTHVEILKSRTLAEGLVDRMKLTEHPEFTSRNSSLLASLSSWFPWIQEASGQAPGYGNRQGAIVRSIMGRVTVKTVKTSNLLQISMNASTRELAANMLHNYIELYFEKNLEEQRMESLQAAEWLKEEVTRVENRLREAQIALLDFTIDHSIVDSKDGGLAQVIAVLNKKMEGHIKAQEARARVQALEEQDSSEETGILLPKEVASNEYIGKLKQELAMMESDYTQMRGLYSSSYPKLQMLQNKIKFLTHRIETMEKNLVSTALTSAKKEEMLLEGSYDSARREAGRVRSLEAQYAALRKDVDTHTEFQKILLKEYKQMDIRARTIANDIKTVDRPSLPPGPSWPKRHLFLLVGSLSGLVLGIAAAFVADRMDTSLKTPRDLDSGFGVERLGVIPDFCRVVANRDDRVATKVPHEFVAYEMPNSPASDAVRDLESSIFPANSSRPIKCLAVSSAVPSEGKTFIAVSIATALALDKNKRVVVVDADLRRPRLQSLFANDQRDYGFTSILDCAAADISRVVHAHANLPQLFYVASGPRPNDPVSILRSNETSRLFQQLREAFDFVIVDCPPILGFPDVPIVCANADGLVLVARQRRVTHDQLKEALKVVSSRAEGKVLGVVMNMAYAPGASRYGYRYYGDYHYSKHYRKYYTRETA
jgi:polysaccharide biosynthesis transport protein